MPIPRDERGFALPLTILVVTVMTLMIASAYVRVRADRTIAESSGSAVDALAAAQSGLHRYLAYYDSVKVRPADGDSLRINVAGGYADVRAYKVRSPADTMELETYIVRSTGHVIEPTTGSDPQAQRTVAQFAQWQSAAMKIAGAFTAANGLSVNTSGTLRVVGFDQCANPVPAKTGVRARGGGTPSDGDFDVLTGNPPLNRGGGGSSVAAETGIDWPSIVGGQFDADYDSYRAWDASFPSMLIDGNLTLNSSGGYGLLMVTGDLTVTGFFFSWRGVILVGGRLVTNTMFTSVRGVTATGLNEGIGVPVPAGQLGGGWFQDFYFYDCEVSNALSSLVGFVPLSNTWIDNWATY